MDKKQKENWINCWLQKFGDRDNETFHAEVIINDKSLNLILQYNYNFDGDQIDPSSWCISGFKNVRNNKLSDKTEEELDEIIDILNKRQYFW